MIEKTRPRQHLTHSFATENNKSIPINKGERNERVKPLPKFLHASNQPTLLNVPRLKPKLSLIKRKKINGTKQLTVYDTGRFVRSKSTQRVTYS